MIKSKFECGDQDIDGGDVGEANCEDGRLLRDIEEISRALYLNKAPSKGLFSSSNIRSKSAEKTRVAKPKVQFAPEYVRDDLFVKDKKLSSAWNWRKPLKALTHIGSQKFHCCFNLHVHSVQGLPSNFNGISLRVHWKRKNSSLQTRSSMVFGGAVEFDETLAHKCSVYGSGSGTSHSVKYDSKRFMIYVSIVGAPEVDIGHHEVDLTRLLPLTLEALRGDNSSGKWTTSFRLAGSAMGASLHVSFSYQVLNDELMKFGGSNPNVLNLINLEASRSSTADNAVDFGYSNRDIKSWQSGSYTHELQNRLVVPHSDDATSCNELLLNSGSGLSKSISLLYQKLDEQNLDDPAWIDSKDLEPIRTKIPLKSEFPEESIEHECDDTESDDTEFSIIEQGVETSDGNSMKPDQERTKTIDVSTVEIINVDEIIKDDDIDLDRNTRCDSRDNICHSCLNGAIADDSKLNCSSTCADQTSMKAVDTAHETSPELVVLDNLDALWPMNEFLHHEQHQLSLQSDYKTHRTLKKSHSLDDFTESVANDFLNMLATESDTFDLGCHGDPQSPREQLLSQFVEEALSSGNFSLYFDANKEELGIDIDTLGQGREDFAVASELSLTIQSAEEDHERASRLLLHRRNAKMLEDLETDSLMQQWGLNEKDFENSPGTWSGGFGSPIELPNEESSTLPSIEEGLGSFVETKDGGFLKSMSPSLFRHAKIGGKLIVQASNPLVLPAEMGNDVLEILLHMASDGVEDLYNHIYKLMPLQDITGKSIKRIAWEATTDMRSPRRHEFPHGYVINQGIDFNSLSLEAIAPIAIGMIETLLIEGLRIQSGMSTVAAPSSIRPQQHTGIVDVNGLIGLSVTLDQWLRLDSGIIEGDLEQILKVLKAHHSKISELDDEVLEKAMDRVRIYDSKYRLLGNHITVACMIQLRDPLRNYEPVGVPMLVLTQVERVHIHDDESSRSLSIFLERQDEGAENEALQNDSNDVENSAPQFRFKISEIHLASVTTNEAGKRKLWGTGAQRQSAFRWLRTTGMDSSSTAKHSTSKSKAIVRSFPLLTNKLLNEDILWSISCVHDNKRTSAENVHIRNPDIIFSKLN
ncbi:hypothetical protein HN51_017349 [Arachis hypogaea]|uniref:C2 NT-type domain-containing protein n=1 Tax=Arachis hypogaea TaxID=3818 RepID=A0A445CX27_ARAHY|nr:uncharacterized protein DS421_16g566650 [Arachis hypogaea]RYR55434.1 hypothetical protein Ahy_A06g030650 [Arachis hypogaea]